MPDFQLRVHPGKGVVAKLGPVLLVVPRSPESFPAFGSILAAVTPDPGAAEVDARQLLRRVAGVLVHESPQSVPPFSVIVTGTDEVAVMVHGAVEVTVGSPAGDQQFSGHLVPTWVDRVVEGPIAYVRVVASGKEAPGSPSYLDLRHGIVPGGGASLVLSDSAVIPSTADRRQAGSAAPADELVAEQVDELVAEPPEETLAGRVDELVAEQPVELVAERVEEAAAGRPDDIVINRAQELAAQRVEELAEEVEEIFRPRPSLQASLTAPPARVTVRGILCSMGHFNPPRVLFCTMCGMSMVHQSHELVDGPRLPLGVLVADDGAVYSVDRDYVLGRAPSDDSEVRAGRASPLVLQDEGLTVSPVHAAIVLSDWDVRLVDRGSAHGTAVLEAPAGEWRALAPGESMLLSPRTRMKLGDRCLSFYTHHRL